MAAAAADATLLLGEPPLPLLPCSCFFCFLRNTLAKADPWLLLLLLLLPSDLRTCDKKLKGPRLTLSVLPLEAE